MDIVNAVLEKQRKEAANFKPITVEKDLDCAFDLGYLMCSDPNELNEQDLK